MPPAEACPPCLRPSRDQRAEHPSAPGLFCQEGCSHTEPRCPDRAWGSWSRSCRDQWGSWHWASLCSQAAWGNLEQSQRQKCRLVPTVIWCWFEVFMASCCVLKLYFGLKQRSKDFYSSLPDEIKSFGSPALNLPRCCLFWQAAWWSGLYLAFTDMTHSRTSSKPTETIWDFKVKWYNFINIWSERKLQSLFLKSGLSTKLWWSQDDNCKLIHNIFRIWKKEACLIWRSWLHHSTLHTILSTTEVGLLKQHHLHIFPGALPCGPYWPPWGP